MNKCEMVFKVVRELDGRMWSANPSIYDCNDTDLKNPKSDVCEYKLGHVTYPKKNRPVIFVCKTLAEAKKVRKFFAEGPVNKGKGQMVILRGYAPNLREQNHENLEPYGISTPAFSYQGYLCDWFLSVNRVKL